MEPIIIGCSNNDNDTDDCKDIEVDGTVDTDSLNVLVITENGKAT